MVYLFFIDEVMSKKKSQVKCRHILSMKGDHHITRLTTIIVMLNIIYLEINKEAITVMVPPKNMVHVQVHQVLTDTSNTGTIPRTFLIFYNLSCSLYNRI